MNRNGPVARALSLFVITIMLSVLVARAIAQGPQVEPTPTSGTTSVMSAAPIIVPAPIVVPAATPLATTTATPIVTATATSIATPASTPTLPHAGNLKQEPTLRRNADLPVVTLREFRSSVPEIGARAATDIFITALMKTRKFRVVERARIAEGIAQEKALNQQGMTTGQSGDVKYVAARYVFEGTVSESQSGVRETRVGVNIMGFGGGRSATTDTIGIDVRVIDVESGAVLDAIDVAKPIYGESTTISGVADGLANLISRGRLSGIGESTEPNLESKRKDSVDKVLRACIEEAVSLLTARFAPD